MARVYNRHRAGVPDDAVSIERGTPWGNPFRVNGLHGRRSAIARYRKWLFDQPELVRQVREQLGGKDLVCCCAPQPCHGDVLLEVANAKGWLGAE